MSKKIQAIRGMNDLLPKDSSLWLNLEKIITNLFISYGYKNIRTPIVEKAETFCRSIGQATDIVEKEMYSWADTNGEILALRPEGTASIVRSMIEHNLPREGVQKVFYLGQMFRHERPQKGRYRQFNQAGIEVFGANESKIDAELIMICHNLWQKLGLKNISLEINTLGSNESRKNYKKILVKYFNTCKDKLDEDSLRRLETNPLRILDSKNKSMQNIISEAPKLIDHLDDESKNHFDNFKSYLEYLEIPYTINPSLVRGLDYYNKTVFEWISNDLGSQGAICAGGRYDFLFEKMGGNPTSAVGFAMGLERLILLLEGQNLVNTKQNLSVYLVVLGEQAQLKSMQIVQNLHSVLPELILYNDITLGSFKSQFKKADKSDADYAIILGEEEVQNNTVSVKPLKQQGLQQNLTTDELIKFFKDKL